MDDNCGEWVECMCVVSRRQLWLVGEGGIYGCGCKEVYRFPHTTYPHSSCVCFSIPTFCSFLKMFFVLVDKVVLSTFYTLYSIHLLHVIVHVVVLYAGDCTCGSALCR